MEEEEKRKGRKGKEDKGRGNSVNRPCIHLSLTWHQSIACGGKGQMTLSRRGLVASILYYWLAASRRLLQVKTM
jgi:hypothetical protein